MVAPFNKFDLAALRVDIEFIYLDPLLKFFNYLQFEYMILALKSLLIALNRDQSKKMQPCSIFSITKPLNLKMILPQTHRQTHIPKMFILHIHSMSASKSNI